MERCFQKAKPIIDKLIEAGHEAYFVGGSVRDTLLNQPIGDIDIATSALPEQVQALFERTIPVGIQHGTVVVLQNHEQYEVTTFRLDGEYTDFRRPSKVEFVSSLFQDLSRRDFTINAMAMDIDGAIIDPFGGEQDLQQKLIQTVGSSDERFHEDPLRMMRALRFMSQLDFQLSETTKNSIVKNAPLLRKISIERILIEFDKLLLGKANEKAVNQLVELGLHKYLPGFAEMSPHLFQYANHLANRLETIEQYWALLLHTLQIENISSFLKKWKSSNDRIKCCMAYCSGIKELEERQGITSQFVYKYGEVDGGRIVKLYCIIANKDIRKLKSEFNQVVNELPIRSRKELAITGDDLLKWYTRKPGPWVSAMLDKIEQAVIEHKITNEKMAIREWLKQCNPRSENNY